MEEDSRKQISLHKSSAQFSSKPTINLKLLNSTPKKARNNKYAKKIKEHRTSQFISFPTNFKNSKILYTDKKVESPKEFRPKSPNDINKMFFKSQKGNQINKRNDAPPGFLSTLNKFISKEKLKKSGEKDEKKMLQKKPLLEKYLSARTAKKSKRASEVLSHKTNDLINQTDSVDINKEERSFQNMKIKVTIKEDINKKTNSNIKEEENKKDKIYFNNDDEILEYIKKKLKEGKIKNILEKLEIKNNNFTGISVCIKNNGYITKEIDVEDDLKKVNEVIKNQNLKIKNRPIEFIYADELDPLNENKQDNNEPSKEIKNQKTKPEFEKSTDIGKIKDKIMSKALGNQNIKDEKMNNEIKILQNKINKYKEELKENDKESVSKKNNPKPEIIPNIKPIINNMPIEVENKVKRSENNSILKASKKNSKEKINSVNFDIKPDMKEKKEPKKINEKRVSRAYNRFKKTFSANKQKENEKNTGNSDKIQSIALMLQDHIMKPLVEIKEEQEKGGKFFRYGSVECNNSKLGNDHFVEILQNAPISKKKVKKPKLKNNFVE